MNLANRAKSGTNLVSSRDIVLNGVEALSPERLNQQAEFTEDLVNLNANDEFQMRLSGHLSSRMIVTIQDTAAIYRVKQ
jgi:hypothetical protein